MKITTLALTFTLFCAALAPAADPIPQKPVDTSFLKKYAETRRFMLGRPQNPKVAPDGKTVLFLRADADKPTLKLFEFDCTTGKSKEVLSPTSLLKGDAENLTPEEKARRERMRLSAGGFADFHFDNTGKNVLLPLSGKLFVFERATGKALELKTGEGGAIVDPKWSPDGKKIAYVRGHDVYVYDLAANKESAVTKGGTAIKTHGLAEFVAQEEMGRFTGFWWSPDGKHIAYEEADHTGVETWFVADPFKPEQKPAEQFYPRPGKKNVSVRLGVIPVEGGETVWVEWDRKKYEYLAKVTWAEKAGLLLVLQSRDQQTMAYDLFDPANGKPTAMRTFLPGGSGGWYNLPPTPIALKNGTSFLVPHQQIENIIVAGPKRRPFAAVVSTYENGGHSTKGGLGVGEVVGFDERADLLFTDHTDPTQQHLFRFSFEGDETDRKAGGIQLTTEPGVHTAVVSKDCKLAVITSTTLTGMPVTKVVAAESKGRVFGTLPSVAVEPDFKPNVKVEKVGDYYTAIVRPKDFDPKKKYPVILDVYGGPKHLHVVQAMRNWLVPQWLADQGFIVVAIDNRGTPGRGREWEKSVYQKFGTVPLEDQVKGLKLLCDKFPELDKDRVGIVGWSFGGYMAANGVLRAPDVFKAAVAGAPVTDWEDYDTHYTERYMGLLPESKKAYDDASLLPLAKDLKRPLLLVHGTADDNVYYRHTLKLANALFREGKDFETLPLPGATHMYTSDPVVMERLWAKTATFFKTHLGEPK
jgi:dipeptidyl-peptidase-4